jgi:hypothetical protein
MDAFRTGLSKLPLPAFSRVVDHCLGENGPERMPSVRECWSIYKRLRTSHVRPALPQHSADDRSYSESLRLVNLMFFAWLRKEVSTRGSNDGWRTVGDVEMRERRAVCIELASQHDALLSEHDPQATIDRLATSFTAGMARIPKREPLPTDSHCTWTNGQGR